MFIVVVISLSETSVYCLSTGGNYKTEFYLVARSLLIAEISEFWLHFGCLFLNFVRG